ncbi:hypothetical protein D3C84_552140 [compost metagenome]
MHKKYTIAWSVAIIAAISIFVFGKTGDARRIIGLISAVLLFFNFYFSETHDDVVGKIINSTLLGFVFFLIVAFAAGMKRDSGGGFGDSYEQGCEAHIGGQIVCR